MPRFLLLFSDDRAEVDEVMGQELAGAQTLTEALTYLMKSKYRFAKVLFFKDGQVVDIGTADLWRVKDEGKKNNKRIR